MEESTSVAGSPASTAAGATATAGATFSVPSVADAEESEPAAGSSASAVSAASTVAEASGVTFSGVTFSGVTFSGSSVADAADWVSRSSVAAPSSLATVPESALPSALSWSAVLTTSSVSAEEPSFESLLIAKLIAATFQEMRAKQIASRTAMILPSGVFTPSMTLSRAFDTIIVTNLSFKTAHRYDGTFLRLPGPAQRIEPGSLQIVTLYDRTPSAYRLADLSRFSRDLSMNRRQDETA